PGPGQRRRLYRHRPIDQAGRLIRRRQPDTGFAAYHRPGGSGGGRTAAAVDATDGRTAPRPRRTRLTSQGARGIPMNTPAATGRQGILSLAVKDKAALYNAYMPFMKGVGIFVPTPKR